MKNKPPQFGIYFINGDTKYWRINRGSSFYSVLGIRYFNFKPLLFKTTTDAEKYIAAKFPNLPERNIPYIGLWETNQ